MTTFVEMYHPLIPGTSGAPREVAAQAVDDYAARGWLLVDPDEVLPDPVTPYYTKEALLSQIQGGASPIGTALRAAFVAATKIYVTDYLPADWVGGDAAAETAAFQAACDAAGDVAAGSKGCVVLPDATILLNAEVVTAWTGMTIMGGSEKSYIKLTTAGARLRINSLRVRLINFRVNGQDLANNGIVFSNGGRAKGYSVRVENCLSDGWLVDPGSVPGGNCNLIALYGCESVGNNGHGFAVANSAAVDATSFRLIECEGSSNSGHGALLRDNLPGIVGGSYMTNGGFGIKLGEAGDTLPTTGAQIRYPRIEGNAFGPFSEGVGTNAIIELDKSYSDAVPGGSGGTSGYTVNAIGGNWRVGYSGTLGGFTVRASDGKAWQMRNTDGSLRIPVDGSIRLGNHGIYIGDGSPEGVVTANVGSLYLNRTTPEVWQKITGTGNTGWALQGSRRPYVGVTADYTALVGDEVIVAAGSAAKVVTLPAATSTNTGKVYVVKRAGSGATSYQSSSAIDGTAANTPIALAAQYDFVRLISSGTVWYRV